VGGVAFAYDATGNMTLGLNGKVMSYDAETVAYAGNTTPMSTARTARG
jgi:hypothetical protein